MKTNAFRQVITRKVVTLSVALLLLLGFAATSAQARDDDRGRNRRGNRQAYENRGRYERGRYHRGYNRGRRHHHGYWRNYHGRRYWYQDGGYYSRPGGISIRIGL